MMITQSIEVWKVTLNTQSIEDDPECGKLANFVTLTNYRLLILVLISVSCGD
ncbi:hypothetical protein AAHE18_18G094600 [Arachis hypogaea]